MGSIFRPKTTVVSVPSSSQSSGSSEVKPYAPTIPFIDRLLPQVETAFDAPPQLFTQSLVPQDSAQTLAGREGLENLSTGLFPQLAQGMGQLYQNRLSTALSDPTQDAVFKAQTGDIANQARLLTEGDKLTAQQQAIEAGQFGLGATSLAELQELQRQKREETTQSQLAAALQQAEARRVAAIGETPGLARQLSASALTPSTIQQQIGKDVEGRESARLADDARRAVQQQEAERLQLITKANLISGLAGLGTQTAYQGQSSGTQGQAFAGPSTFSQVAGAAGNIIPFI
tara:strand:+ start:543 stop:1406 length:864 start_codon:yes stop_codon:yes gene_type:complete